MGALQNKANDNLPSDLEDLPTDLEDVGGSESAEPGYFERAISGARENPITAGLSYISETIDPYTGAPLRAAVGGIQEGKPLKEVANQTFEQFLAGKVLPTTPSGEDITYKALMSRGTPQEYAESTAEMAGPLVGGALDITNFIPGRPLTKTAVLGKDAVVGGVKMADRGVRAVGRPLATGLARTGEVLTAGGLDSADAAKAMRELSAWELMFPGSKNYGALKGAGEELGAARKISEGVESPGSTSGMIDILDDLTQNKDRFLSVSTKPQRKHITKIIEDSLESGKEITVNQIDDLIRDMDNPIFKTQGGVKESKKLFNEVTKSSRKKLREMLGSSEEGADVLSKRNKYSNLTTASKGGGQWRRTIAFGGGGAGALVNPLAIGLLAVLPGTYYTIASLAKAPYSIATGSLKLLTKAYEQKNVKEMAEALSAMAKSHPDVVEHIARGVALAPGRVDKDEDPRGARIESLIEDIDIPQGE